MPHRYENLERPTILRRSPRFLHPKTPLKPCHSKLNPNLKSINNRVSRLFDPPVGSTTTVPRNSYNSSSNSGTGLRRSSRLNHGSPGIQCTGRASRFPNQGKIVDKLVEMTRDENNLPVKRVPILRDPVHPARASRDSVRSSDDGSGIRANSRTRSRKSTRSSNSATGIQSIRRSARFLGKDVRLDAEKQEVGVGLCEKFALDEDVRLNAEEHEMGVGLCEKFVLKKERSYSNTNVDSRRTEVAVQDSDIGNGGVRRKSSDEWTKEQEMALQNAYFTEKPTPHFWKKVSKMVPGKSAQDCFDKIHSTHLTPPQPKLRTRARKTGPTPLSASKLLKPTKSKRSRESYLGHKTIRLLLEKQCQEYQDHDQDLFSVLEPATLSTPQHALGKIGFNKNCHERFSSARKNRVSSCKSSIEMPLVSPPVLKQVKNKAVHEKYIAQLHRREAKRMAASSWVAKSHPGKGNMETGCMQSIDVVRAARSALVSDAQDAIEQFRHKQINAMCHFFEFDGDGDEDGVEDEEL